MSVAELVTAREKAPRSLAERAYELLVREITRLELAPGEVLADKTLTERFDIGRTPMREALQRLAREGLVVHVPNRGMFVSEISAASVQQIYEFRSLIDGHAARLAATRASAAEMDDLTDLHRALVDATERDDIDTYVVMDRLFHEVLAHAAQNVYLAEVIPAHLQPPPSPLVLHLAQGRRVAHHRPIPRGDDPRRRRRHPPAQPQRGGSRDEGLHRAPPAGHSRAALNAIRGGAVRWESRSESGAQVVGGAGQSRRSRRRSIRSSHVCMVAMEPSCATSDCMNPAM